MLPLVRHVVSRMAIYLPPTLSQDDLLSAGVVGLIQAIDRFDPLKNTSIKTFAAIRIRGAVLDEMRRLAGLPRSVFRETRQLVEAQNDLAQALGREPTEEEICARLNMARPDFEALLDRIRPVSCFSLDDQAFDGDTPDSLLNSEILADPTSMDAAAHSANRDDYRALHEQLQNLPRQQLEVLSLYYMEDLRLKEIAQIMSLTESRVSQIHTLAINRLRNLLEQIRKS